MMQPVAKYSGEGGGGSHPNSWPCCMLLRLLSLKSGASTSACSGACKPLPCRHPRAVEPLERKKRKGKEKGWGRGRARETRWGGGEEGGGEGEGIGQGEGKRKGIGRGRSRGRGSEGERSTCWLPFTRTQVITSLHLKTSNIHAPD